MKRLLIAALAALGIARGADATTLIVSAQTASSGVSLAQSSSISRGWMNQFGATYDAKPWSIIDTTIYRTAYLRDTVTRTGVQYDAIIVDSWDAGAWPAANDPRRACTQAGWSCVPMLFVGQMSLTGPNKWSDGGGNGDTTGTIATGGGAPSPGFANYRSFDVANGLGWYNSGVMYYRRNASRLAYPGSNWVPIVGVGAAKIQVNGGARIADMDTIETLVFNPDSVREWKITPCTPATAWRPASSIKVFVDPGYAPSQMDPWLVLDGIAEIDSASNRKVLDNAAMIPQRGGMVIGGEYNTGNYRAGAVNKAGWFCASDSCDSVNTGGTHVSLSAFGERVTLAYDPDSIVANAWQKPYLARLGTLARWCPMVWRGTTAADPTGIASTQVLVDLFGENLTTARLRRLIPPSQSALPCNCPAADSSIYCMVKSAFTKTDSLTGRTEHILIAPRWAWARTITRGGSRTLDSLAWVLYMAGARALAINLEFAATPSGAGPWENLIQNAGALTVYDGGVSTGRPIGYINVIGLRTETNGHAVYLRDSGHDLAAEYPWGRAVQPWYYVSSSPFYVNQHQFFSPVHLWYFHVQSLGGNGQGTVPYRPAWWLIRQHFIETQMINRHDGRKLWLWDWAENVASGNPGGLR